MLIVKKIFDEINDEMQHTNWGLYKGEYDCLLEILEYANYLKENRRKLETIQGKLVSLKYWYDYIEGLDKNFSDFLTSTEQSGFLDFLDKIENVRKSKFLPNKTLETSTINRHIANTRQFYDYLATHGHDYLDKDNLPLRQLYCPSDLGSRNEHDKLPDYLKKDEVKTMIEACTNWRDKSIIVTMASTGIREGELCALTIPSIDYAKRRFSLRKTRYLDLTTGKLKTGPRDLHCNELILRLLQRYFILERNQIAVCNNIFVNLQSSGGGVKGGPLTRRAVKALFTRLRERTGIEHCHAHALRHTFATNFLRSKKSNDKVTLAALQKLLGHKNIDTVQIYTHLNFSDFQEEMDQSFNDFIVDIFEDLMH